MVESKSVVLQITNDPPHSIYRVGFLDTIHDTVH